MYSHPNGLLSHSVPLGILLQKWQKGATMVLTGLPTLHSEKEAPGKTAGLKPSMVRECMVAASQEQELTSLTFLAAAAHASPRFLLIYSATWQ